MLSNLISQGVLLQNLSTRVLPLYFLTSATRMSTPTTIFTLSSLALTHFLLGFLPLAGLGQRGGELQEMGGGEATEQDVDETKGELGEAEVTKPLSRGQLKDLVLEPLTYHPGYMHRRSHLTRPWPASEADHEGHTKHI
jgi:hypothetical protein